MYDNYTVRLFLLRSDLHLCKHSPVLRPASDQHRPFPFRQILKSLQFLPNPIEHQNYRFFFFQAGKLHLDLLFLYRFPSVKVSASDCYVQMLCLPVCVYSKGNGHSCSAVRPLPGCIAHIREADFSLLCRCIPGKTQIITVEILDIALR